MKNTLLFILLLLVGSTAFPQTPYTDPFSGPGGPGSNYTCGSNASITFSKSSGTVTASAGTGSQYAYCRVTSKSFTGFGVSNMYVEIKDPTGGPNAGPALLDGSGNGYAWFLNSKQIGKVTGGTFSGSLGYVCPWTAANDVTAVTIQGTTISCVDVTKNGGSLLCPPGGNAACGSTTDSSYTPTHPGIMAGAGASLAGPLITDCFPATCGVLPSPTPSVGAPVTLGTLASITAILPSNSVGCYTKDGTTPATPTTFGTCPPGTTTYHTGDTITLTPKAVNTINMIATSATNAANSGVATWVYTLLGVAIKANQPQIGSWLATPGTDIWMNSHIQFGTLNTCTAAISGNYGGATGTLDRTSAGPCIFHLTVGSTHGTCTATPIYPVISGNSRAGVITSFTIVNGGSGLPASTTIPFSIQFSSTTPATGTMTTNSSGVVVSTAVTNGGAGFGIGATNPNNTTFPMITTTQSTAGFNVVMTAVDDPTTSATFPVRVCANSTTVDVLPFYSVRYANQGIELQSITTGNADIAGHWTLVSQPSGGDGTLDANPIVACETTNTCLTTYFNASVAGRYTVQYANADGTTNHATIYVTGNTQPRLVTPNGTEPIDPTVDPYGVAHGGHTYEVGPGQTYKTINAINFLKLVCGDTIRVHNAGTNGSPTTYFEWIQIGSPITGCIDNPLRIVGVPNASGELPVMDGTNAAGPSTANPAISGMVSTWAPHCGVATWAQGPTGSCGPKFVVFEGFRIQNSRAGISYYPPNRVLTDWGTGAGIMLYSGYGLVVRGNDIYNTAWGLGTFTPQNNVPGDITQMVDFEGNRLQQFGVKGSETIHGIYAQSWGQVFANNLITNPFTGFKGSDLKTRSFATVIKYNFLDGSTGERNIDQVDLTDAATVFNIDNYFCQYGNCATPIGNYNSTWIWGRTQITPTILAGFQTTSRHGSWIVGNVINSTGLIDHYAGDQYSDNSGFMKGTQYFEANTVLNPSGAFMEVFDEAGGGSNPNISFEYPYFDVQGNIIDSSATMAVYRGIENIGTFGRNLFRKNAGVPTVNITPPIVACFGCGWDNYATPSNTWQNAGTPTVYASNIDSAHFLFTPTLPSNATTFVPVSGSAAINSGAPFTGLAALFPARQQFRPDLGYATLRTQPMTLGAIDGPPLPALSSIAITPSSISLSSGVRNSTEGNLHVR